MIDRVWIDGLTWCAECRRAVDRGWAHAPGCSLAPDNPPSDEELRATRARIMEERISAQEQAA